MRCWLIIGLLLMAGIPGHSQDPHPILNYFTANLSGDQIYLSWEIKGGSQCNGVQIYRSTDSVNWVEIGDIQGVCGSPDFPQQYGHTDTNPTENTINYYRLELGAQGLTGTVTVHYVVLDEHRYNLFPHPVTSSSELHFDNASGDIYEFRVIDLYGRVVFERTGVKSEVISLRDFDRQGSFVFILDNGHQQPIRGRVVTH